ncbi:Hsp70 family protein-like protein [Zopfia rhizophila CBS 207.26]|uniref:Hsp70 family protein-like protein n=1 Tax=Zopfia rhizophila CBS 207.26 TaxID=1314779 RepID=A0A6A6DPA6_9PEZI|nr:Hsp70 family protein-like protein [Zopfia rhizophila CBS 207.26]
MERDPVSIVKEDRIVIAIDFGTTFSSVAYTVLPKDVPPEKINIRSVKCIGNYPGYEPPPGVPDVRQDVPTELWYDDGRLWTRRDRPTNRADDDQHPDGENEESSSSDDDLSESEQSQFEDDGGLEANAATQHRNARTIPATQYWGFGVQQKLSMTDIPRDEARPLTRFKLNLDRKKETDDVRTDLRTILKALSKKKIIKSDTDIYAHYLTHLLKHTKEQLLLSNELYQDMLVQFVLCVPAKWPMNACRIMQTALEEAVKEAGLSEQANRSVHNMFMISEPEAAAECILAEARSELYRDETVVIVDAGGGTVDAVTYKCENDEPLRLSAEVVAPDSKLCGASYINEKFENKLLQKLASEEYLVKNGKTLKSIVQAKTTVFENSMKRRIDTSDRKAPRVSVYIDDLRENPKKHFYQNRLELKRKTMREFFEESLEGVKDVLENQLELAESEGHRVQKVILTGGFGQSPSLQSHLRAYLKGRMNINGWEMDLIVPKNPSTAVARGAVLRALNKRLGPSRITQCSYGILISEPYKPEVYEEHRRTKCRINKADGEKYVDETIQWVIQAGERVKNMQEFAFDVKHTFPTTRKKLLYAEQLWMSDHRHPLHYRRSHPLNKGAEKVGSIVTDLTFLKDERLIEPQLPSVFSTHSSLQEKHWEAHYEVAMIVEGRSIRFEARWPLKDNLKQGQKQRVLAMKLVGIAAAFQPGTA